MDSLDVFDLYILKIKVYKLSMLERARKQYTLPFHRATSKDYASPRETFSIYETMLIGYYRRL